MKEYTIIIIFVVTWKWLEILTFFKGFVIEQYEHEHQSLKVLPCALDFEQPLF